MKLHYIFTVALTALMAIPAMAQDRNNDDEVVKVDAVSLPTTTERAS